jgi:hypothetical protein
VDEVNDTSPSLQAPNPENKYGSQSLCDNHKSFVIRIERVPIIVLFRGNLLLVFVYRSLINFSHRCVVGIICACKSTSSFMIVCLQKRMLTPLYAPSCHVFVEDLH